MGTPTQYYVDPSLGSDTGDGTVGTPWGRASGSVVQYSLDTITQDTTNGDQINIKSDQAVGVTTTTDDVLTAALTLATYGNPNFNYPLIFKGYTASEGDGGIGGISGDGSYSIMSNSNSWMVIDHLHLHNSGSAAVISIGTNNTLHASEIDNTTGNGVAVSNGGFVSHCHIHNCGGVGITAGSGSAIMNNYLVNGTNDFSGAMSFSGTAGGTVSGNIMSLDGSSNGIAAQTTGWRMRSNSILSNGGTGTGIKLSNGLPYVLTDNLIEGFSGVGGKGVDLGGGAVTVFLYGHNALYNNATNYSGSIENWLPVGDNESLGASPFAKSGADTFANRFVYFAPVDTGNVHGGAYVGA